MKGFALVSWLALAGLTAALYLSPDEPLRAVESEEVDVTLRNFSLQRPELVQMSHVTPQAPAVKEEEPVAANENTANAEAPLPLLGDVNNETIGHANLKNRSERTESLKRK